jgi:hypothetical protein
MVFSWFDSRSGAKTHKRRNTMIAEYVLIFLATVTLAFLASWFAIALEEWIRTWRNERAIKRRDDDPPFAF